MADRVSSEPTLPEVAVASRQADSRRFALTVLYHPDIERIGEIASLEALHDSGSESLSRLQPEFAALSITFYLFGEEILGVFTRALEEAS